MHWTEAQIVGLAKAFYRFDPVVCLACTGHVAVERMALPLSGGASHLRFSCRGCGKRGELAGFVEPAPDEWTEREREAIAVSDHWRVQVRCPRDGAVLSPPEPDPAQAPEDSGKDRLVCPICGRRAAVPIMPESSLEGG